MLWMKKFPPLIGAATPGYNSRSIQGCKLVKLFTPRLILREWQDDDLPALLAMGQDPQVMRFFPALMSEPDAVAFVCDQRQHFLRHGFGIFALVRQDTGAFIGFCGCKLLTWPHDFPTDVEIGWRLAADHWGRGFATEAARTALDHYFALKLQNEVVSFTIPDNRASWSVMERLKMARRPDLDFAHPRLPDGHPFQQHIVYVAQAAAT